MGASFEAIWRYAKAQWLVVHIVAFLQYETKEVGTNNLAGEEEDWQLSELELAITSIQFLYHQTQIP